MVPEPITQQHSVLTQRHVMNHNLMITLTITKTSTTTGVNGTAEFTLIGTADVKVSTLDYNAVAGTNAPGQTCALAGNFDCAVGATAAVAFTATTAGTVTTNAQPNITSVELSQVYQYLEMQILVILVQAD